MTPEQWKEIDALFQAAIERAPDDRAAFLDRACAGNDDLRREVDSLLSFHDRGRTATFLDQPPAELAAGAVDAARPTGGHPARIGPYEILGEIGRGGMGQVFLAKDPRLGRRIAIKVLPADFTLDDQRVRRFKIEARAASALNHPNILIIHEIGESQGRPFIATEFVEGRTLREMIEAGPLPVLEALDVASQVAAALSAAHGAGIVHRDIKPENVMVRPDGYVKVLDFSIAKLLDSARETASDRTGGDTFATRPGALLGTIAYMSPEQIDEQEIDARTDIFSLGVVLYEMLTGARPFLGKSAAAQMMAILESDPKPLAEVAPELPAEFQRIVDLALAKNRDARYQSASELLADLKALRQQIGASGEHSSPVYLPSGTDQRRQAALATTATDARPPRRWVIPAALAALVLVVAVGAVWLLRPTTRIDTVAVLPFAGSGASDDQAYLSDGITEGLIGRLSQVPGLRVMARNCVFRYKGATPDPRDVGRELGVGAVVTGSITRSGDVVTISAELVDAKTGLVIWQDTFVRRASDLPSIHGEIAADIASQLDHTLSGERRQRVARRDTSNTEAYDLYLRGLQSWNHRTEEGLRKSIDFYNRAIALDPDYALAYAALANSYVLMPVYSSAEPVAAMTEAKKAAMAALERDPNLAEAHTALAFIASDYEFDMAKSDREYQSAISDNPNYATAHQWYSSLLAAQHRYDEAITEARLAQQLDPASTSIASNVGATLFYAGRYEEAAASLEHTVEYNPASPGVRAHLALVYAQMGRHAEALEQATKAVDLSENAPSFRIWQAYVLAVAGRRTEASNLLQEIEATAAADRAPYQIASVHALLDDRDAAFAGVERAIDLHDDGLTRFSTDPAFAALRDDPRYAALLARLGLRP